jgi:isocitrate dehydrogenase
MQTAADIMTSPVVSIGSDASVAEALAAMRAHGVSSLLVEPAFPGESHGFFSQTDAVEKVVAPQLDPASLRVGQVMSRPVITVPPQTTVQDCALLMHKAHIRRVLVHDGHDIIGIVSTSDVLGLSRSQP